MATRAISLNITVQATDADMRNEQKLRELCMQRMHHLLGTGCLPPYDDGLFIDNVTIEQFDELGDDEE